MDEITVNLETRWAVSGSEEKTDVRSAEKWLEMMMRRNADTGIRCEVVIDGVSSYFGAMKAWLDFVRERRKRWPE